MRVRTHDEPIQFNDGLQGAYRQRLESESGDFVIKRRDGLIAYHLAVAVDDVDQGITEVVRGIDLLDSTPRQLYLQRLLGLESPAYAHFPVAENAAGQKLSKMTGAPAVDTREVRPVLVTALSALGQAPDDSLAAASLESIWQWAIEHWQIDALRGQTRISPARYILD